MKFRFGFHRWLAVFVAAVLVSLAWWSLAGSELALVALAKSEGLSGEPPPAIAQLAEARVQSTRVSWLGEEADSPGASRSAGADVDDSNSEVWVLVAELERLAQEPESFHGEAIGVIDRLGTACEGGSVVAELLERVVHAPTRANVVRGAVLLAVATQVSEREFGGLLRDWFAAPKTPTELIRAAGIACAMRGSESNCGLPVDLGYLGKLQSMSGVEVPGVYPLRIKRVLGPADSEVIRAWLDEAERRAAEFAQDPERVDHISIGEYFVTAELLFALWAQGALYDLDVERVVLQHAFKTAEQRSSDNLLYFRVANFVVHSLAACNNAMFDLVRDMAELDDPILKSVADSMIGQLSGGLGIGLVSKIESVRYGESNVEVATLLLSLDEAVEGLAAIEDPVAEEEARRYIDGLIVDPMVSETARASALITLAENAEWESCLETIGAAFDSRYTGELYAAGVTALVERAGDDAARCGQAIALMETARSSATEAWVRRSLQQYIAELSQ